MMEFNLVPAKEVEGEETILLDPPHSELGLYPLGYNPLTGRRHPPKRDRLDVILELTDALNNSKVLVVNLEVPADTRLLGRLLISDLVAHVFELPQDGSGHYRP